MTNSAANKKTRKSPNVGKKMTNSIDSLLAELKSQDWLQRWPAFKRLMRLDRPIGTLLLLWPTLWALWLAAEGVPSIKNLIIFTLGVLFMRAAGCVINDYADRNFDGHVKRTSQRPLVTGEVSPKEALILFAALMAVSFILVLLTNALTVYLSFAAAALAASYPFMKRFTFMPQLVLGMAFAMSVPMAYAAQTGELNAHIWLVYTAVVLWTVAYDTFYAMVDRDDDLKIGIKSTAILFGEYDKITCGLLQAMTLWALVMAGQRFELGVVYYLGLLVAGALFAWQQWLIRHRSREACFSAFLNNNWVGLVIFVGLALDYAV